MIILGIDPGIGRTGYAFLKHDGKNTELISCGCITTDSKTPGPQRLLEIKQDLDALIKKFEPDSVCLETLFFQTNVKTAMAVGQARGVAILACAENKLKIIELSPLQVKISATGYGKADKSQVQKMVMTLLKLKKIPKPDDAADACAIAWAGIGRSSN